MTTWNAAPMPELGLELVRDVDRERIRSRLPRWDPRLWQGAEFSKNTRPGKQLLKLGLAWGRERVNARKLQQENVTPRGDVAPVSCFTGKEEDAEFGIVYFGKRFYSPGLNRWVTADPLAVHAAGKADLNLYAYVRGSVLRNVDPLGLDCANAGGGGACNDPNAGAANPGNTPRAPEPNEKEYRAGKEAGKEYGEYAAWVENLTTKLSEPHNGVSAFDRMTQKDKLELANKIVTAASSLPKVPSFETNEQNEAALRGFKAGAESAYSNDRLAATFVTLSAKLGVALVASRAASANIVQPVTVQSGKWDYFFGRVASSEHNKFRSLQNLRDLNALGFDEAAGGRAALLKLFQDSQKLPEVARHVTDYGVTITRTARVGEIGAIDVKYFYPGGNMKAIPEVSSIIPKIFK